MRLREIRVKEYRILKNFSLDFGEWTNETKDYTLHLVVGVNGTGKSTLLRLLARLFLQIRNDQKRNPPFGFEVSYQLERDAEVISITNLDAETLDNLDSDSPFNDVLRIRRLAADKYAAMRHEPYKETFDPNKDKDALPPRVIAFTTGSEKEWKEALQNESQLDSIEDEEVEFPGSQDDLKDWALQELPGAPITDDEPEEANEAEVGDTTADYFHFISTEHIPLVALCGMLVDMHDAQQAAANENVPSEKTSNWKYLHDVMEEARIEALRGFSLRFRMNRDILLNSGQDILLIEDLRKLAFHTVQIGSDYLLVFHLPPQGNRLRNLLGLRKNGFSLFSSLARLTQVRKPEEPLLYEVNLFLERSKKREALTERDEQVGPEPLHLFKWLSDGEQSFLGRLCLMPLLRDSEALVLLDEPEVHFNDYWKRQLVYMLENSLVSKPVLAPEAPAVDKPLPQPCHVLMTTHSSITLTDVFNTDILILKRRNGYTSGTVPTSLETMGADPSDIIVSIFGAKKAAGERGVTYIKRRLAEIEDSSEDGQITEKTVQQKEKLEKLAKEVGPGFWRFLILRKIHELEGRK